MSRNNQKPLKQALRKKIRNQRNSLSKFEKQLAANKLLKQLIRSPEFVKSQHIALYLTNDSEIDTAPIIKKVWSMGKTCYLPVLSQFSKKLTFVKYTAGSALKKNRYKIPEPYLAKQNIRPAWSLDIILTPLIAFDDEGNRLGMGGGFYDQTFAFKKNRKSGKPLLIGLAYSFQHQKNLHVEHWDVCLDKTFTDQARFDFINR